ncbi:hypothetical protein [Mesorhizobium sp. M0847]|uniref:hypothetical protein n=1 Tax=unclassified Mesorhizobium TaxID=325217 RepID=UPI003336A803
MDQPKQAHILEGLDAIQIRSCLGIYRVFLPMSVLRSSFPAHVDAALPAPRTRFSPGGWQVPNMSSMCRERAAAASKGRRDSKKHFAQQIFQGKVWKEYDCTEALSRSRAL